MKRCSGCGRLASDVKRHRNEIVVTETNAKGARNVSECRTPSVAREGADRE